MAHEREGFRLRRTGDRERSGVWEYHMSLHLAIKGKVELARFAWLGNASALVSPLISSLP